MWTVSVIKQSHPIAGLTNKNGFFLPRMQLCFVEHSKNATTTLEWVISKNASIETFLCHADRKWSAIDHVELVHETVKDITHFILI